MDEKKIREIKQQLLNFCSQYVKKRIETIQQAIHESQVSANEETKSSAGDKYETGRSMMHLEMEKNSVQLNEAVKLEKLMSAVSANGVSDIIGTGSIVLTDKGNFYIAISAGPCTVEGDTYMTVAHASPIGKMLLGLSAGQSFTFNGRIYQVVHVR